MTHQLVLLIAAMACSLMTGILGTLSLVVWAQSIDDWRPNAICAGLGLMLAGVFFYLGAP